MRSELIGEIFTIETQAEKIVLEAEKKREALLVEAQNRGEQQLTDAIQKERKKRETLVQEAQDKAQMSVEELKERLAKEETEDRAITECAQKIARNVVSLIEATSIKEGAV